MQQRKNRHNMLMYCIALCDLGLLIFSLLCFADLRNLHNRSESHCTNDFEYNSYTNSYTSCINFDSCAENKYCRVLNKDLFGEGDDSSCDGAKDCDIDNCSCSISAVLQGIYLSYASFLLLSLVAEAVKLITVLTVRFQDFSLIPLQDSAYPGLTDSWTFCLLKFVQPERYNEMITASENGKLPLRTRLKVAGWIFRDYLLTLLLLLCIPKFGYFSGYFYAYMVFWIIYWLALLQKVMYTEEVRAVLMPAIVNAPNVANSQQSYGTVIQQPIYQQVQVVQQMQPIQQTQQLQQNQQTSPAVVYAQYPQQVGTERRG